LLGRETFPTPEIYPTYSQVATRKTSILKNKLTPKRKTDLDGAGRVKVGTLCAVVAFPVLGGNYHTSLSVSSIPRLTRRPSATAAPPVEGSVLGTCRDFSSRPVVDPYPTPRRGSPRFSRSCITEAADNEMVRVMPRNLLRDRAAVPMTSLHGVMVSPLAPM
jgi:hypothetical protein